MTAWSHLPNAHLIDQIIHNIERNRTLEWTHAQNFLHRTIEESERNLARQSVWVQLSKQDQEAFWSFQRVLVRRLRNGEDQTVWDTFAGLAVWDAGYLFEMKPEEVQVLVALRDKKAIVLYPAVAALAAERRQLT